MSLDILRPVHKQSAESLATDSLREYLLSGALAPGARLTETALAERLGVARATLRTALHRLTGEGLVVQTPYTGWHVASLLPQDVWEIWTLRGSLESLAARLCAQRIARGEQDVHAQVQSAYQALVQACERGELDAISIADFELHHHIIAASGHLRLARQYAIVEQQVRLYIATSNSQVANGPQDILQQHEPLARSLLGGLDEQAAQAAWQHNHNEGHRLMDWLSQQETA